MQPSEFNISVLLDVTRILILNFLKEKFKCKVGLSDHSKDNRVAIASIAAGAEMIEKHIALDNQKKGFDIELAQKVSKITTVPIVVSGGAGNLEHIHDLFENQDISGCALGSILHYNDFTIQDIKSYLSQKGHKIR